MTETLLDIDGLSAGYDGVPVVRDLSLQVRAGEVVALLGPNGAGKTTTLRAVSGLVGSLEGDITVMGGPVPRLRRAHEVARRGVAHVPEGRAVLGQLTVRENLVLAVRRGRPDFDKALHYFPALAPLMERKAALLSGGEQKMLVMGRAILSEPRLLLLDELSLGLAPLIFSQLLPIVRRVVEDTGAGALLVEQYAELALSYSDRAYVLSHGDLVLSGPSSELLADRARLDAAYLGSGDAAGEDEL